VKKYVAPAALRIVNEGSEQARGIEQKVAGSRVHEALRGQRFARAISFVLMLSLSLQVLFLPYHQALGALAAPPSDNARIASELKGLFGDAAALCVQVDDKGAPTAPAGQCNDHCPFCRFAAEAGTLVVPDSPALPVRFESAGRGLETLRFYGAPRSPSLYRERARAPPFPV
jgi:hypothetical protein